MICRVRGVRNAMGGEVCTVSRGSRSRDMKEMKELPVETLCGRAPQTKGRARNALGMFKDLQELF